MDTRFAVLTILSFVIAQLVRAAKEDLPRLRTFSPATRALFVAGVSIVGAGIDGALANHVSVPQALLAAFMLGGPGLLMMVIEWLGGGNPPAAGGTVSGATPTSMRPQPSSYSATKMMGLALALGLLLPGCGPTFTKDVANALDKVVVGVLSSSQFLDVAEQAANAFFAKYPQPDTQTKVSKLLADGHSALDAILQADQGATDATQLNLDAAKEKFLTAYAEIVKTLQDLGVVDKPGKFALVRGEKIALPVPLLVKR